MFQWQNINFAFQSQWFCIATFNCACFKRNELLHLSFVYHPAPGSQWHTTHTHTHALALSKTSRFWGVRARRTVSLTDITIPGNGVESGRRGRYVDIWVDVMKTRTFSLQSCVTPKTPWKPASLFLADFPPKSHTGWNICTQTHMQAATSSLLHALAVSLTVWTFQWGQSVLEALTKCHVLLGYVSLTEITARGTDAHR